MTVDFAGQVALGLAEGRALAEALMVDTVTITREARVGDPEYVDTSTLDPETGQYPEQGRVVLYGPDVEPHLGRCRLQSRESTLRTTEGGDRQVTMQRSILQIPVDAPETIGDDQIAELVTSSQNPANVGRTFTIKGRGETKTHPTKRELEVVEVTG